MTSCGIGPSCLTRGVCINDYTCCLRGYYTANQLIVNFNLYIELDNRVILNSDQNIFKLWNFLVNLLKRYYINIYSSVIIY